MFGIGPRRVGAALALVAALVPVAACYDTPAPSGPSGPPAPAPYAVIEVTDAAHVGQPTVAQRATVPVEIRSAHAPLPAIAAQDDGAPPATLIVPAVVARPIAAGERLLHNADGEAVTVRVDGVEPGRPPRVVTLIHGDRSIRIEREWTPTDAGWVPQVQRVVAHENGSVVRTIVATVHGLTPGVPPSPDGSLTGWAEGIAGLDTVEDSENCYLRAMRLIAGALAVSIACAPPEVAATGGLVCLTLLMNLLNDIEEFQERCVKVR